MPRKKGAQAKAETQRAHEARLRYLSRNPDFRRDIESLAKVREALPGKPGEVTSERLGALRPFVAEIERAAKKWDGPWDMLSVLCTREWYEGRDPKERIAAAFIFSDSPVVAWTDAPLPTKFGVDPSEPTRGESRYLNLRVDLEHPADTLLPFIEKELNRRSKEYRHSRRRLNEVDFNIRVFDLAKLGESFKDISAKLGRHPSTIKSALVTACRNIFGDLAAIPSKKQLPLVDFDPSTHFSQCPTCKVAGSVKEFCKPAQLYVTQDEESQRDHTRLDTVARDIAEDSTTAERVPRPDELLDS